MPRWSVMIVHRPRGPLYNLGTDIDGQTNSLARSGTDPLRHGLFRHGSKELCRASPRVDLLTQAWHKGALCVP
jgi:hypothetical protein